MIEMYTLPKKCPNCGHELKWLNDRLMVTDFRNGAPFTCQDCGATYMMSNPYPRSAVEKIEAEDEA